MIVHAGGISYGRFPGDVDGHVAVGEDGVVYVANGDEGDAMVVTRWDALIVP